MLKLREDEICIEGIRASVQTVLPTLVEFGLPESVSPTKQQLDYCAIVGITGGIKGRLIIEMDEPTLNSLALSMYGMEMEGDMLASFFGEIGNMIAGNMASATSRVGLTLDISPPTVMVGESLIFGVTKAVKIPVILQNNGELSVILSLET